MALGCTVGELLQRISAQELAEWMAYAEIEPFGESRADLRAGIIASTVANRHRSKKEKRYKATDFLPKFERKRAQTAAEMLDFFRALNKKLGG